MHGFSFWVTKGGRQGSSNGNNREIYQICPCSRPMSHPVKAVDLAQQFLENVYKLHGLPTKVISDRDPVFVSTFWKELMLKLKIQLNLSTSYHPHTDGQSERLNQCVEQYLRCMVGQNPKQWVKWLYLVEW